jgi:hypothetical protein
VVVVVVTVNTLDTGAQYNLSEYASPLVKTLTASHCQ